MRSSKFTPAAQPTQTAARNVALTQLALDHATVA
jgi:hypothetical protein